MGRLIDKVFKPKCSQCGDPDAPWNVQGLNLCGGCKSMMRANSHGK